MLAGFCFFLELGIFDLLPTFIPFGHPSQSVWLLVSASLFAVCPTFPIDPQNMSTLDESEQFSPIEWIPLEALHRPSPGSYSIEPATGEEGGWKEKLSYAICVIGSWIEVKEILDQYPSALTAIIDSKGKTALHLAAQYGNMTIVEALVNLVSPQFLLTVDYEHYTALSLACWYTGNTEIAKCFVNKNSRILAIPNNRHSLPVTVAFENNFQEMGRYLYSVTPFEFFKDTLGTKLLCFCLQAQYLDISLDLLQNCEELLFVTSNNKKMMPIHHIATLHTDILSPNTLVFWKRWIYDYIPSAATIKHVSLDIQQEDTSREGEAKFTESGHGLLQRVITSTSKFAGVKKIQELKLLHSQADDLLFLVCNKARKEFASHVSREALCLAAKEGNVEFVLQLSKFIPESFLRQFMLACFAEALHYRQARVFNLIHGFRFKPSLVAPGSGGNTLLHTAAEKAPDHILNRIYAPTLQMQRELQWFKEVESFLPEIFRGFRNWDGFTAKELFRESHKDLMKEGEKWMKDTVSSCSIVGTLIVTIMFAAAFTIPGGNDQNFGYPLFIKQPFFKVFIFSTILSFLSSSTSILVFLSVITSHYSEEKFLRSLPTKLLLCLSFLFISVLGMITSFLSAVYLMLKHSNHLWGLLPIIIIVSVPIFLFVLSQFPLLIKTYLTTHENIFDRNVKPWP